ncbi:hypothetical protein BDV23DRAFT_182281 [Aspergillus alliaceus]|uniref:Uncharacterized protein n=1 Tax=Petromyces alliaceus TaxID=209559 RepID=A0A5N7CC43_PETAA|nr:hypothetical protein BDV23DRAFT_182281 [Aspergillus alliaceus]
MRVAHLALCCFPFALAESFFTELEDVTYSIVEYIPLVGISVANFLESSVRDVILVNEITQPAEVALLHTFAELFTDKMIDIFAGSKHQVNSTSKQLDQQSGYVIIAEGSRGQLKSKVFESRAKGVHHFHGAKFKGRITDAQYAPKGEDIYLDIPH